MRHLIWCALLALAACNSGSKGEAEPAPSVQASASPAPRDEAAALLAGLAEPRQKGRYAPRDDCAKVAGAGEFRASLAKAVLARDVAAIAALTSPDVRLGFGGDDGRERMVERMSDPRDGLIGEIERLLPLGCGLNQAGDLVMPWIFAQDLGDIDGYTANLVTGEDVPLHAAADAKSAVSQRLSWDIVELGDGPDGDLLPVVAPDGSKGFVPKAQLRSLLDYRLLASRESGAWKITAILAGD